MPAIRGHKSKSKTRRLSRFPDQTKQDIQDPSHLTRYLSTKAPEDLPGLGKFYCIECSKWFEDEHNLEGHKKGKVHKRRLKDLKAEQHSQQVSNAAVGLGVENVRKEKEEMSVG